MLSQPGSENPELGGPGPGANTPLPEVALPQMNGHPVYLS